MRVKVISNHSDHLPDCTSVKLHKELMYYTDIILLGLVDAEEWDDNLKAINNNLPKEDKALAEFKQELLFNRLYYQSKKDNYYWEYCPFPVYKDTLNTALKQYHLSSPDSTNRHFYISELIDLCEIEPEFLKKINSLNFDFSSFYSPPKKIKIEGKSGATFKEYKEKFYKPTIEDTQKRKIEYILELLVKDYPLIKTRYSEFKSDRNEQEIQPENPFPRIFKDYKSYQLFKHLQDSVNERTILVDYSFIYWSLSRDNFIYSAVRPTEFINFLNDSFQIALSDLKQYENCLAGKRTANYQTAKLLFK